MTPKKLERPILDRELEPLYNHPPPKATGETPRKIFENNIPMSQGVLMVDNHQKIVTQTDSNKDLA
jgi:hypothetical protein